MVRAVASAFIFLCLSLAGARADGPPYITPADLNLTAILAPAPAPDSAITREDVRIMLDLQAARTPEMVAMAVADVERSLSRFSDAVGTDLSPARAPLANRFMEKITAEGWEIVLPAKNFWHRIRPYNAFPEIKLVVPPETSYSYPSGHATYGMGAAIVLAQMVPERATSIFARGIQFGFERALAGVHYPSDIEAGRLSAVAILAVMMRNPAFQADFKAAQAEVRGLIGLKPPSTTDPVIVEKAPPLVPALPAAPVPAR